MVRVRAVAICLAMLAALLAGEGHAARKTVCTITVNSPDEKQALRARLPKGEYEFVELVQKGRPDWLRASCDSAVQCDVLVVSGHFNAGDTFYSDSLDKDEYLEVDELERASCSASCPGLFSRLKEVYLFGCESLNPDATRYASSFGESGRDRMRRLFPDVPSIYGFQSSAPLGPTAAMLLNRYFDGGGRTAIGSGRRNERLLRIFGRNHMTHVPGVRASEPLFARRGEICEFYDDRKSAAQKLAFIHQRLKIMGSDSVVPLRGKMEPDPFILRVEKALAGFTQAERATPEFERARARIAADDAARERYLAAMRRTERAEMRARMIAVGGALGWLSDAQQRDERVAMVNDLLARPTVGFADVELMCSLNGDRHLDGELQHVNAPPSSPAKASHAALLACLGSAEAHREMLSALVSADADDIQIARAYLRHRPIGEAELRNVARGVTRMQGAAQIRALDAIARLNISDREVVSQLARTFAETKSADVQRAIAEVFVRADPEALLGDDLARLITRHRVRVGGGGQDLIDVLLARLQAAG